jgi:hypothetical protein
MGMSKICFVISPLGRVGSPLNNRANSVLETYIEPACKIAGYQAIRADKGIGQNILRGTTTALQNAPMAIAYLGSTEGAASQAPSGFWNGNVMIEVGYRLASKLPLVFACDLNKEGELPPLPMILTQLAITGLPKSDFNPLEIIKKLSDQIKEEEKAKRLLDCIHPLACINAASRETEKKENLIYTAGSKDAHEMFSVTMQNEEKPRLVGCNMDQFLDGLKKRMHPQQWKAFEQDQQNARKNLRVRITDKNGKQSIAAVPIVFQSHENEDYNNRAYLPIIVQDFRDGEGEDNWYSLRVLYLNVTSVTQKAGYENEEHYICTLDPSTEERLPALPPIKRPSPNRIVPRRVTRSTNAIPAPKVYAPPQILTDNPIRVFISYTRRDQSQVEPIYNQLVSLGPTLKPFWDNNIEPTKDYTRVLAKEARSADIWILFIRRGTPGRGMDLELSVLQGLLMTAQRSRMPVLPVLLHPKAKPPFFLSSRERIEIRKLDVPKLRQIMYSCFPSRCPTAWSEGLDIKRPSSRPPSVGDRVQ